MIRCALAEDNVLLREGLTRLLDQEGFDVVAAVGTAEELLTVVAQQEPDVVVTDIRMPPTQTDEGLRAAVTIRKEHADVAVLVLSHFIESRYAVELLTKGSARVGYLLKDHVTDVSMLTDALRHVVAGGSAVDPDVVEHLLSRRRNVELLDRLSQREREILARLAEGRSNRAICAELFISPKTLESHISRIFSKLDLQPAPDDHRRVLAVLQYLEGS